MQASADKLTEDGSAITLSKRVVHESYAKNKMAAAQKAQLSKISDFIAANKL